MKLFRRHRARLIVRDDGIFTVLPCRDAELLRDFAESIVAQNEWCTIKVTNAEVEELLRKLGEAGYRRKDVVVEVIEFERTKGAVVAVCPECLAPALRRVDLIGLTPPVYVCENCGYVGSLVLELKP